MTYTPTDEQIEALADEIPLGYDLDRDRYTNVFDAAAGIVQSPAFQAIIRAAQAEAFRKAAAEVRADFYPESSGWVGYLDDRSDAIEKGRA